MNKFIRQAKLPRGAYPSSQRGLSYYAGKAEAQNKEHKRWCKNHPTSFWGKDKTGNYYAKCSRGFRTGEECEIGQNE